jgi:transcriptional regulator with XRE-family HTH domain
MSNKNVHSEQIGLRIRAARKAKGLNQTELANLLEKSLRTIQKYENGEINISIDIINQIAKVLECEASYLIGYDTDKEPLSNLSDILQFFFKLDRVKDLNYEIEIKKPPSHDGWSCSITFNGKDKASPLNQDLCLFLEQLADHREDFRVYKSSYEDYTNWQDKTTAYHSAMPLEEKEVEELSTEERLRRLQKYLNERYGK